MSKFAFERRSDSSVSIFDIDKGRQYIRQRDGDGGLRWMKRALSGELRSVSGRRARRLERVYRRRDEVKKVRRRPRLNAEDVAFYRTANRIAELEVKAYEWIARGRDANIELGRIFSQIKALLKHGEWKPYVTEKFVPRGIPERTARAYMQLAREADNLTETANSADFSSADDPQAKAVRKANVKAKAAVAEAVEQSPKATNTKAPKKRKKRPQLDGMYNLPLPMTGEEKDATDLLRESENWPKAERKIKDLLQRLAIKYVNVNRSDEEESHDAI